jgi:hypothetical protein
MKTEPTWLWTFGFHKMLDISWVAAQLAASQEGLSSMSEWMSEDRTNFRNVVSITKLRRYTMSNIQTVEDQLILSFSWGGVRLSPLGTSATNWPIVPAPDCGWRWMWSSRWNENWQGKPKYPEKTCSSATFSTTNPPTGPGLKPGQPLWEAGD